jgi:glycosyltransferase involved in cell wall biosynthesis
MRILKLTVRFPPAPGGVEFQQLAICKELARRGHEVEVFSSDLYSEIPFKRLDNSYSVVEGIPVTRFKARSLKGDFQYSVMPSMLSTTLRGRWDIIHAHSYGFFPSHVGAVAGRAKRGTFVFTPHLHPGETTWGGERRKRMRMLYDRFLSNLVNVSASKIICVSEGELNYAVESGFDRDSLVIVPDSVDISRFDGIPKGAFKSKYNIDSEFVLFVGRLAKNKGLEYLVEAIPQVLKDHPRIKFVLIGEDEGMREILLHQSKKFGIKQNLIFTGPLDYGTVSSAFVDCSLFVLPSEFEAFGIVLAEAQAARKPCVATKVGGVPNVVKDKQTGLLVDFGNSRDLAQAICDLLDDKDKSTSFGEAGYKWVSENFAIENVVDRLEEVYEEVLSEGNI